MRHRKKGRTLDRQRAQRDALLHALVRDLVRNGRLQTTVAKAKELRMVVEPLVTTAKIDDLTHRRTLLSRLRNQQDIVKKLLEEYGPRYQTRPGGYTRITRTGVRVGDGGEQAMIEFVE